MASRQPDRPRSRQRKTEFGITDYNALTAAVKAVKIEERSLRDVSKAFGIPKSSLARYVKRFEEENKDISKMNDADINALVQKNVSHGSHRMV